MFTNAPVLLAAMLSIQDGMAQAVRRQEYHPLQTSGPMVTGPYVGLYGRDGNPSPEHISKDIYSSSGPQDAPATSFPEGSFPNEIGDRTLNNIFLCSFALSYASTDSGKTRWPLYLFDKFDDGIGTSLPPTAQLVLADAIGKGADAEVKWQFYDIKGDNLSGLRVHEPDVTKGFNIFGSPWWPWAIVEGALRMNEDKGGDANVNFEITHVLEMLSGFDAEMMLPGFPGDGNTNDEDKLWKDFMMKSKSSPVLINVPDEFLKGKAKGEYQDAPGGWYAVQNTTGEVGDDREAVLVGLFNSQVNPRTGGGFWEVSALWSDLATSVTEVVHFKDFVSADHRPDHPSV